METESSAERKTKLIRYPTDLDQWFEAQAERQQRSVNAEIVMAMRFWQSAWMSSNKEVLTYYENH
jgi:hypothetical protein